MGVRVLFLGPVVDGTGNKSTGVRIKNYFEKCVLEGLDEFEDVAELNRYIEKNRISCIICLHAYRSGRLLQNGCSVPYAVIFGGTDLNVFSKDENCRHIMTRTLSKSRAIVTFDKNQESMANAIWPEIIGRKLFMIPQAVSCTLLEEDNTMEKYPFICGRLVLVLVAGLRIEKDPLFLLQAFQEWHDTTSNDALLLVVGPKADKEYSEKFLKEVKKYSSVKYLGCLPQQDVFQIMKQSLALVNSSRNEGMSNGILEAMSLGVPVIARAIDGNKALISDGYTGLLYNTPHDFIVKVTTLQNDPQLRKRLTINAERSVNQRHDPETEKRRYVELVNFLLSE